MTRLEPLLKLKRQISKVGRKLANSGFHAALAGNISARFGETIVCTSAGSDKGELEAEQIVVCDMAGELLEGTSPPTSEILMHLCIYLERPDVNGVIHAHPPNATAFAAASEPLDRLHLPEMLVWLGPVALVPYGTPGTPELSAQLRPYLSSHNAFLLENHGALTVGSSLRQAAQRMELVEQNALITLKVRQLGKQPFALDPAQHDALTRLRRRLNSTKA